jgi:hypothetical protein
LTGNRLASPFSNRYCLGMFRSGVFSIWSEEARGRAVNRCAVLHKGPAMAFLSPWCSFKGEIRAVQSYTIISNCDVVISCVVTVLLDLAIFMSKITIIINV